MNTKRSYLDNLNAGRQRRSDTTLEDISRTLDQLESRLGRTLETRQRGPERESDIAQRMQRLSEAAAEPHPENPRTYSAGEDCDQLQRIARQIESSRHQEDQLTSIGSIAEELKALREDMRAMVGSGLRREFNALREELAGIMAAAPQSPMTAELNAEFERLSRATTLLAERSDDKSTKMLRLELEQVKASLDSLAREETVRSLDKRWDTIESQLATGADPAIERLGARLEEIGAAVEGLPGSLSLHTLEECLRTLASSLDQFAGQPARGQHDLYAMIEERLDEISRAITASAALAHSSNFDEKLLERIEARISSLANQINELAEDRSDGLVVERLNALSDRIDEVARRIDVPEQTVEQLADTITRISEKLDTVYRSDDAGIMAAMDSRFADLAARIDEAREESGDGSTLRALEARLEDVSRRLQNSASAGMGLDREVIRNLEAQVASLSAHLERPGREVPEFEDLAPRLEKIEQSIGESRAAMIEAARQAAEQAVQTLGVARTEPVDARLTEDLKTLEALTRKSDERNTKTFEAIHDTLLKIVEHLGSIEAGKLALAHAPSIDPSEGYEDAGMPRHPEPGRTPAEAAVAAAEAALYDEGASTPRGQEKRSMLGGLSRAITGRRGRAAEENVREEPVLADDPEEGALEPSLDEQRINEPLEPGSGAPDLNSIMRRVRDEHGTRDAASSDTAKADFIAAARRAAQAAAAEAEILKDSRAETASKGGKLGIGKVLGRRKKHLLLALGTAIVLAGGLQYARTLWQDGEPVRMAQVVEPTEEPQEAAVKPELAKPETEEQPAGPVRVVDARDEADRNEEISTAAIDSPHDLTPVAESETRMASADTVLPSSLPMATPPQEAAPEEAGVEPTARDLPKVPEEIEPASLRQAAAEGNAAALYEIANRYADGVDVEADMAEAARWYEEAAERGVAPAQYRIGNLYEKGNGVERDIAKAKTWYQRAAEQGNASAMHNLGVLYAMGADGTTDNESAARWFQEAADLGVVDSQFNLGILATKGIGVKRDLSEAYKWFDVVARTGDADAAAKRDEIAKVMAPADLVKAQGKAKLWKARQADPQTNTVDIPREWRTDEMATGSVDVKAVDMKKAIGNIQVILNKNGFDAGPADGVMGDRTRAAIKAFQKENGLAETGVVDDALVRALLARNKEAQ
ncbi:peptidoglycan-binding protein [Chelativorans salis]|uniref:Peptidoglycan-binding protein n=1 Tax=Chelativorans salis TaxID=2978478 RepID=A0ABT2LL01_9HYPH|nr:peptidoglycan-binding protein [Chelativorans sp. EGI FJ00035]MCT7374487.1 peptidoglycan-binding protein [Chelativorans sp. EGI FJ00035]